MSAPAAAQSFFARACSAAAALMRTSSKRLMAATIFANAYGTGRNCPGHEARLCGHESQTATCGSHSAGMRKPSCAGVLLADFGVRNVDLDRATESESKTGPAGPPSIVATRRAQRSRPTSIDEPFCQVTVGIDPAIA